MGSEMMNPRSQCQPQRSRVFNKNNIESLRNKQVQGSALCFSGLNLVSAGGFSDSDLMDGNWGGQGEGYGAGGGNPRKDGEQETPQGVIPGIVGAVLAAVVGAVSSFIAYQKKKLCFKENVHQTLLEK